MSNGALPAWVWQSTMSDADLQARWVYGWERKWAACVRERQALEQELRDLRAYQRQEVTAEMWAALRDEIAERMDWLHEACRVEAEAKTFLDQARAAQRRYG